MSLQVLIVHAYADCPSARALERSQQFERLVLAALRPLETISPACVTVCSLSDLAPYTDQLRRFDSLDFIFVDGDDNLHPWLPEANQLRRLFRLALLAHKCVLATTCGMQALAYVSLLLSLPERDQALLEHTLHIDAVGDDRSEGELGSASFRTLLARDSGAVYAYAAASAAALRQRDGDRPTSPTSPASPAATTPPTSHRFSLRPVTASPTLTAARRTAESAQTTSCCELQPVPHSCSQRTDRCDDFTVPLAHRPATAAAAVSSVETCAVCMQCADHNHSLCHSHSHSHSHSHNHNHSHSHSHSHTQCSVKASGADDAILKWKKIGKVGLTESNFAFKSKRFRSAQ